MLVIIKLGCLTPRILPEIIESEVDLATILLLKIVGKEPQQKLIQLEKEVYD